MKKYPLASNLSGHEVWMLWWPLMVPQMITTPIFRSNVFILSPSPVNLNACSWFPFDIVAHLYFRQHQELRPCSTLPISRSRRCLVTRPSSSLLVSTCVPHFLAVSPLRTPPSTQWSSTYPIRHHLTAITL